MLIYGKYKAEHHEGINDDYVVIMTVKETPKSFCFILESIDSHYCAGHIRSLFATSNRVVLKKTGGKHGICVWGDKGFALYPFQLGIPYYFKYIQ